MATQLNFYSNADVSIIDLMNTADGTFKGKHQVSLTNYDNTSLPAIAVGSIVENNGTLFLFDAETAISGTPVDGTNYILLVPSGDPSLGTATVTPTWSQTAPTWSDSKQGWYGTSGSANYRYLHFVITKVSSSYSKKVLESSRDYLKYYASAGTSASSFSTAVQQGLTKIVDPSDLINQTTDLFTCPRSGNYSVSYSTLALSLNNDYCTLSIDKNGVLLSGINTGFTLLSTGITVNGYTRQGSGAFTAIVQLNQGDTLSFKIATSNTTGTASGFVSILEV